VRKANKERREAQRKAIEERMKALRDEADRQPPSATP